MYPTLFGHVFIRSLAIQVPMNRLPVGMASSLLSSVVLFFSQPADDMYLMPFGRVFIRSGNTSAYKSSFCSAQMASFLSFSHSFPRNCADGTQDCVVALFIRHGKTRAHGIVVWAHPYCLLLFF